MTITAQDRLSTLAELVEQRQQLDRRIAAEALEARDHESLRAIGDVLGMAPSSTLEFLGRAAQQASSTTLDDAVIVAARDAYELYVRFDVDASVSVYACQVGRTFRNAKYLGFYLDKTIRPEIARILYIEPYVEYSSEWIERIVRRGRPYDEQLAEVMRLLIESGKRGGRHEPDNEIVILTRPEDDRSIQMSQPIVHTAHGPWTRRQRYASAAALRQSPGTTDELARLMRP